MKRIGLLFAGVAALVCTFVFAGGQQPVLEQVPVRIVARGIVAQGKANALAPLLAIGSLSQPTPFTPIFHYPATPTGWEPFPKGADPLIDALIAGDKKLIQADSENETLIELIGPENSDGNAYIPVSLTRQGTLFTLNLLTGEMNVPRGATPAPTRTVFIVSLGKLDQADYQLDVHLDQCVANGQTAPLYARQSTVTASVPFTVADGNALRMATKPAVELQLKDMKPPVQAQAQVPDGMLVQMPMSLPIAGDAAPGGDYSVKMGTCDANAWLAAEHKPGEVPEMKPTGGPDDSLYAVIRGPGLNSGEWMSLHEIKWDGATAKIAVDVWHDQGLRKENIRFAPTLLAPLTPEYDKRGTPIRVLVAFRGLTAADTSHPYVEDDVKDWHYAQASSAGKQIEAVEPSEFLAMNILAAGRPDALVKDLPGLSICQAPDLKPDDPYDHGNQPLGIWPAPCNETWIKKLADGHVELKPPTSGAASALVIASESIHDGEMIRPVGLVRQGNQFTLVMQHWDDAAIPRGQHRSRQIMVMDIGTLSAGHYSLVMLTNQVGGMEPGFYRSTDVNKAYMEFDIAADGKTMPVMEDAGKTTHIPATPNPMLQPEPMFRVELRPYQEQRYRTPMLLVIGTFDLQAWLDRPDKDQKPLPDLKKAMAGDSVYALVNGPDLSDGDFIRLSGITWDGAEVSIHMECFTDQTPRKKNIGHQPVMIIPIKIPSRLQNDAGTEYTAKLMWVAYNKAEGAYAYSQVQPDGRMTAEAVKFVLGKP